MTPTPRFRFTGLALTAALLSAPSAGWSQEGAAPAAEPHAAHMGATHGSANEVFTPGEVRKIDRAQGKITLKHGPILNLDMPGMTMVFRVSDPALLERCQPGDQVRFKVIEDQGKMVITDIQPAS